MFDERKVWQAFSRAAADYEHYAALQKTVRARALAQVLNYWPKQGKLLDIGSGAASIDVPGRELVALDVAFGMCEKAREQGVVVVNADSAYLPFAEDSFDGVFSSLMLQWVNQPVAVFKEMRRVMRPGSIAVVTTLVDGTLAELKESFATLDNHPHVSRFLVAPQVISSAAHAGFAVVEAGEDTIVESYENLRALMRALKAIGANNKEAGRVRGLLTPRQLKSVEVAYREKFANTQGLPASWQVLTLLLMKA